MIFCLFQWRKRNSHLASALADFLSRLQIQQNGNGNGNGSGSLNDIQEMEEDNEKVEEVEIAGTDEEIPPEKYTRKLRDSSEHVRSLTF